MSDPGLDTLRSVILERLPYAARQTITRAMLGQASIEQVADFVGGGFSFTLRTAIFAQRLDEQVVRYPADWWQAFKRRFFPRWALRRWPALEVVKTMRLYAWYPDVMVPDHRSQFVIQIRDEVDA